MAAMPRRRDACCPTFVPEERAQTQHEDLSRRLSALAEPTRLAIVDLLAAAGEPVCVCDLVARFRLGQPTISHHLAVLRAAGLVSARRKGRWTYYRARAQALRWLGARVERLADVRPGAVRLRGDCS
jgi:ArsR family transcriptional regulator